MPIRPDARKRIDEYIASVPDFAKPICRKLRAVVRKADPGIVEDWKWGPNFNKQGMVCGFGAFKAHVTFTFFKGSHLKDPKGILAGCSDDNAHNRSIKFRRVEEVDEKTLAAFVREAAALNVKGVKVEARRAEIPLPADLGKALAGKAAARKYFDGLTPGYRREYIEWVVQAKRPETRLQRIETTVRQCREKKTLHFKYRD